MRLRCRRVDDRRNLQHTVRREPPALCVHPDQIGVWSDIDARDLVLGDIALNPLDIGSELAQHTARLLRDGLQLRGRESRRARNLPLDDVLRHAGLLMGYDGNMAVLAPDTRGFQAQISRSGMVLVWLIQHSESHCLGARYRECPRGDSNTRPTV